jgi:DNA-binding NarL/FixJ family response regulator
MAVLLVDDDAAFRDLARGLITAAGLDVVGEAESVAGAIAAAHELRPAAALVDIGLPDGDGISLARELAALPWSPRVLLTSADAGSVQPGAVDGSGAVAFIPKTELPNAPLDQLLGE